MFDPAMLSQRDRGRRRRPLLRTIVGDVLRRTRREQGRTLADVACSARVSMPYLSELERGRKEASSEILAALCDALGLELSELLALVGRDLSHGSRRVPSLAGLGPAADRTMPSPADAPNATTHDQAGPVTGGADAVTDIGRATRTAGDINCLLAA